MMQIENMTVEFVRVGERARPVNADAVKALAGSIEAVGLRTPITVHVVDEYTEADGSVTAGVPFLVAGRHRLEAARLLGWENIPAVVVSGTETDFRLWEIAENLHRAELSVQERADHISEWVRLVSDKMAETPREGRPGAKSAAARELGVSRKEVERAVKVASITPEARAIADEGGLDTQKARLDIASAPKDQQAARAAALLAEEQLRTERRRTAATDGAIRLTVAEELAQWILERADLNELPAIISMIEGAKPKEVIAALRREAA